MLVGWQRNFLGRAVIWIAVLAPLWTGGADVESRAFDAAQKSFDDGFHERAEKAFSEFVLRHAASPRVPQALLLEAQAALAQKKFPSALVLLATNLPRAGVFADQFDFWTARIYAEAGQWEAAATNFAAVVAVRTNSPLRLEATLREAQARFQLRQWPPVVALLQNPAGLFQQQAALSPASEPVVEGRLLLAEALLEQRNFAAAELAVAAIPEETLPAKLKWRREYLRARAQFAGQKLEAALATTSNLVAIASVSPQPALEAASVAMQGEIWEALNQPAAALAAYAQNQRPGVPADRAREALFRIVQIMLAQGQVTNALARLQAFLTEHPNEAGSDMALLTVGELRLKEHQSATEATHSEVTNVPGPGSSLLTEALENCDRLLREFTNSPFLGQAHLVRGWAWLVQGKPADSLAAFQTAAQTLPWSQAQAVARFKAADLKFQTGDITNALRDYRRVVTDYESLSRVQSELVPRARYQMLQASRAAGDLAAAEESMQAILRDYPQNGYAERALLLYGQTVDELGVPAVARKEFTQFGAQFPNSSLRPEAELAVARSFERERNWPGAIAQYDAWVLAFPTNEQRAGAEFRRALANSQAGRDTNALQLFTNFIAVFPTNPLGARAQEWVGDYYYNAEEFPAAERNYQLVYQNTNWPASALGYRAKLKAGRAALLRLSFDNATNYFTKIIEDTNCPSTVVVQAYFAYGDAYLQRPSTNALGKYSQALTIYEQVPKQYKDDPQVPRAWGQMANCYFQMAGAEQGEASTEYFAKALEFYGKVTNAPAVDVSTRQMAEVGLGHVLEQQARLRQRAGETNEAAVFLNAASDHYLNVVYAGRNGETPDPLWVKEAALSAAALEEARGQWKRALELYQRLREMLPALRASPMLERKVKAAREQLELRTE